MAGLVFWSTNAWCLLLILTALLPLLPVDFWLIRFGDFPRLQLVLFYLVTAAAVVAFQRSTWSVTWGVLLVACSAFQLFWIFSYLPIAPHQVEWSSRENPSATLRLISCNVLQENTNAEAVLSMVQREQPDVLVLLEVNERWLSDLAEFDTQFAFHLKEPQDNNYGMAVYTNKEVIDAQLKHLIGPKIPSADLRIRLDNGHPVRVIVLHPMPPHPGIDSTQRDGELIIAGKDVQRGESTIVLGDLNDVGWSRTTNLFQEVSGLLDPRRGRGFYSTFSAKSYFWRYPLDHTFFSQDFRLADLRLLEYVGSDHFPLLVEVRHEPDAALTQEPPDLSEDDIEDANEAIDKALQPETQKAPEEARAF